MTNCLVVEDSVVVRRVIREMLQQLRLSVSEATTADQAIDQCARTMPQVILVDWNLPGMDGLELIGQLRRMPGGERLKILMCTVENSLEQVKQALDAGVDEYLMKPFTLDILSSKLAFAGVSGLRRERKADPAVHPLTQERRAMRPPRQFRHFSRMAVAAMTVAADELKSLSPGEILYERDDPSDFAYIVMSGAIEITTERDGRTVVLAHLLPYQLFGETVLLDDSRRVTNAYAVGPTELMVISPERFRAKLESLDIFTRCWIESLADQVFSLLDLVAWIGLPG